VGRKLGVFGGTFDPVHLAHLILAEQAREQLELDQVVFLPAAVPPHKQGREVTDGRHRLRMVELAIAGNPSFAVSDAELVREGISYTVDTLRALHEQVPSDELYLLIGADSLTDLPRWYQPLELVQLAKIAVAKRPGNGPLDFAGLAPPFSKAQISDMARRVIEIPLIEISSSEIRQRVGQGKSIRYRVPAAVEAYIRGNGLYGAKRDSKN
jgi:nicotinate-nucleotide adenylyltransferase